MDEVGQLPDQVPTVDGREALAQRAVQPPSTSSVTPLTRLAAGEARNTTAPATSTGSPMRWRAAIRSRTSASKAGSARASDVPSVRDERRRHGVDVDPVAPPFDRETFRQCATAAFEAQ
jgi:hypothetical protein